MLLDVMAEKRMAKPDEQIAELQRARGRLQGWRGMCGGTESLPDCFNGIDHLC